MIASSLRTILTSPRIAEKHEPRITAMAAGTCIATQRGKIAVERLRCGDMVMTRDEGQLPVRAITMESEDSRGERAVLIRRDAFGHGLPERDMVVAESHRVLLQGDGVEVLYDISEAMARAGDLVGQPGITWSTKPVRAWVSISLDSHDLLLSEGMWIENEPLRLAGGVPSPSRTRVLSRTQAQLAFV